MDPANKSREVAERVELSTDPSTFSIFMKYSTSDEITQRWPEQVGPSSVSNRLSQEERYCSPMTGIFLCFALARHKSQSLCKFNQNSASILNASAKAKAVSGVIPRLEGDHFP